MFQVKASYEGQMDVRASLQRVREFLSDLRNFVELMPGVESITLNAQNETMRGAARWVIRADVPVVGAMRLPFLVAQTENDEGRIEWSPAPNERKNLLRYAATFRRDEETDSTRTRISLRVEVRRQNARELHFLAGLVGDARLSQEMQRRINEMMKGFLEKARGRLQS